MKQTSFTGYDLYDGGERLKPRGAGHGGLGRRRKRKIPGWTNLPRPGDQRLSTEQRPLDGKASGSRVIAGDTTPPFSGLSLFGRALLSDRFNLESQEFGVDVAYERARGYLRYATDNTQPSGKIANIEAAGEFFITKNTGRHGADAVPQILEIVQAWRQQDVGIIYKDECIRVEVVYRHQDTIVGALGKSNAVFLRLTLATLGDQGYKNADFR